MAARLVAGCAEIKMDAPYSGPLYVRQHLRFVYFAAWQNNVALYAGIPAKNIYEKELKQYVGAKSTVRFAIGHPLPVTLINKLVKARGQTE